VNPADARFLNTIREVMGQDPIPDIGRDKTSRLASRASRTVQDGRDMRFVANLARFEGDGNRQAPRKAGAL
jgi:hypothetical protein